MTLLIHYMFILKNGEQGYGRSITKFPFSKIDRDAILAIEERLKRDIKDSVSISIVNFVKLDQ